MPETGCVDQCNSCIHKGTDRAAGPCPRCANGSEKVTDGAPRVVTPGLKAPRPTDRETLKREVVAAVAAGAYVAIGDADSIVLLIKRKE